MAVTDKDQAVQIAENYVRNLDNYEAAGGLTILDEYTLEKPYGWVFFYNTRAFAETHDSTHALTGNAPFLVEREDGSVHVLGTVQPLEDYLGAFEPQGQLPTTAPSPQARDLTEIAPSSPTLASNGAVPLSRPRQGIIAGITAALLIISSVLLFGVYHQAQTASAHAVATVTGVALVTQQQAQQRQAAAATATAQITAANAPYHADIPGNCDPGNASWRDVGNTSTTCTKNALQISPTSAQYIADVEFSLNYPRTLSANNSVEVTIAPVKDCGGIFLRQPVNSGGGYGFFICSDNGYWDIVRYAAAGGTPSVLRSGYAPVQQSYVIKATADSVKETLSIDGKTVATAGDTMYLTTNFISLIVGAQGETGPASFSNFTYTPLP